MSGSTTKSAAGLDSVVALRRQIGRRVAGASAVVFVVTSVTSTAVPSTPALRDGTIAVVLTLTIVFVVAGCLCYLATGKRLDVALAWMIEGRRPDHDERELLARFPMWLAILVGWAWLGGTVATAALNVYYVGAGRISLLGTVGAALGGANAIALTYVVVEHSLVPVMADAMRDERPGAQGQRSILGRLVAIWMFASGAAFLATLLAPFAGPRPEDYQQLRHFTIASSVFGFSIGLAAMIASGRRLNRQIQQLRLALAEVQRGDLSVQVVVDDAGAVGALQAGFNQMSVALAERHRLERILGRQVGEVAMSALLEMDGGSTPDAATIGERREVSVLFLDLVNSTTVAEALPAEEVVPLINTVFDVVVDVVGREGGWVNRFLGDAALCVFGAPAPLDDHAARALRAGISLRARMFELTQANPLIDAGIGIATGEVVLGNVGTASRGEYTVIGDAVNVAARLTDLAKKRPGRVLALAQTVEAAGAEQHGWQPVASRVLRGRSSPSEIWEHRGVALAPRSRNSRDERPSGSTSRAG